MFNGSWKTEEYLDYNELFSKKYDIYGDKETLFLNVSQKEEYINRFKAEELKMNLTRLFIFLIFTLYYTRVAYRWKNMKDSNSNEEVTNVQDVQLEM